MDIRTNKCEDRVSELNDRADAGGDLAIPYRQMDPTTHKLRLTRISANQMAAQNGIKKPHLQK